MDRESQLSRRTRRRTRRRTTRGGGEEEEDEEEEDEEEEDEEEEEEDQATNIKSNNPHLAGGEHMPSGNKSVPHPCQIIRDGLKPRMEGRPG